MDGGLAWEGILSGHRAEEQAADIHARLGKADRAVLEELKKTTGHTESELVRRGLQLVSKELTRRRSALELAGQSVGSLPPLRSCEAVIAEACFLMRKVHAGGPAEVIALARKGVYEVALSLEDHWGAVEGLLKKYADQGISLADACLIRGAEVHQEARILTFNSDFSVYRWGRNRTFHLLP